MSVNSDKNFKGLWDKKSTNYPRFNGILSPFLQRVFAQLKEFGINFNGKNIVDIGCGTGVYTLYISKLCEEITGVDSSNGMLDILKDDAKKYGITNLHTINKEWSDFIPQKHYDIALCTMSPALKSKDDFIKFYNMADVKIYLNFASTRHSSLLEPFFKHYNIKAPNASNTLNLQKWLEDSGISFKKESLNETRIVVRDKNEAFENVCWHLDINNVKYDKAEILDIFESLNFNVDIKDEINSLISLFVF